MMAEGGVVSNKPQSPTEEDPRSQFFDCFKTFSTCIICLKTLDNPHLCPYCSKLYCYACISDWLDESRQNENCPNCSHTLQLDKLVKVCWFQEMERLHRHCLEQVTAASGSSINVDVGNKDPCPKHMKVTNLYCCNCDECVVDSEPHLEHTFKSLEVIYNSDRQVVEKEFEEMIHYLGKITQNVENIDRFMELVRMVKEDKLNKIQTRANYAIIKIEHQIGKKMNELHRQKRSLIDNISDIKQALERMKKTLAESTKNRLISEKENILSECNNIKKDLILESKHLFCFYSELSAFYEVSGNLIIENFSSIFCVGKKEYFSDDIVYDNHIWRIILTANTTDLGITIELVKGGSVRLECVIKLIHINANKIVTVYKTIYLRLAEKSCDIPKFIALDTIINENYLKDDGSLELLYHIRYLIL